ncbi:GNAT family N-acetyltransferase [Epidermidibacterium keratini]|uniref:GNAT family N-acetyltransferase n=1 Tax=Epidermidibacterium keratini TaxID=1891644 RepID=A0A7L4YJ59_9ACTN|nr:GNAT family N-acetyltransferase [Epidermidibacterium keratini]QHB99127.1 GNAT family N-acetyltransferase [Epidermidibacterium keratini]
MAAGIDVRTIETDELPGVLYLRRSVFGDEFDIDEDLDIDGRDGEAIVVAAYDGPHLVGTGRVLVDGVTGRVGRMAVAPERRGQGIGQRLLRRLEIAARRAGAQRIELDAMESAYSLYERAGYRRSGDNEVIVGHRHVPMSKPLPVLRPARDSDSADLIVLIGDAFAEYPGCVLDVDREEPWLRAPATAYAEMDGAIWVYTDGIDGPVVACGAGKRSAEGLDELKSMYVAARARRQGLAADLVELVEQWSANRGNRIHLWTDTRFLDAHQLYESRGYRRTDEVRELHDLSNTSEFHYVKDAAVGSTSS